MKLLALTFALFTHFAPDGPGEMLAGAAVENFRPDHLVVGEAAPDFTLQDVRLSELVRAGDTPVVLVFGSLSCNAFRGEAPYLNAVVERVGERARFLGVYIREAHPGSLVRIRDDAFGESRIDRLDVAQSVAERRLRAQQSQATLSLSFPFVADSDDNGVNTAYAGWPVRFVVIAPDGKIVYKGGQGPFGFNADEVEAALVAR